MTAPLSRDDLEAIAARTLEHYGQRAESFWEGTRDHDVAQNIDALLQAIVARAAVHDPRFRLRPGTRPRRLHAPWPSRDRPRGRAPNSRRWRASYSGCEVWEQDFLKLDLPAARFDGIFANAALFHVPKQELPRVLGELHATLKPGGVLFSSNPRGNDEEGWSGGRFGVWHSLEGWRGYRRGGGFRRSRSLLPTAGASARAAAVACERVAQGRVARVRRDA